MKKNILKNLIMYISIAVFFVITIMKVIHHVPWFDESNAWMLSQSMNFQNVYYILKGEGHFIIWYLLIMPFAKLNLWYPYSMLFINWLCFFTAIIIMWKKAPFNLIAKIIITFAWVSINYYSVVARCYSIGILGLFIIATLYKNQLKKPLLYATILVLTAHTSLLATMAVIPLAMIFIYNLIREKQDLSQKNIIISISIIAIGAILWATPFITGFGYSGLVGIPGNVWPYFDNFFKENHYFLLINYILTLIILFIFADNKIKFFILMTTGQFYVFHSIFYPAYVHNMLYIFIYIIIAYWLTTEIHDLKNRPIIAGTYLIFFTMLLFTNQSFHLNYALKNTDKSKIVNYLNKRPNIDYIHMYWTFKEILPYLDKRYKYRQVDTEYDPTCINKASCAPKAIEKNMKEIQDNWNTVLVTSEKINENSVPFKWEIPNADPVIWYVTTFEKK